jgi:plastocyanin
MAGPRIAFLAVMAFCAAASTVWAASNVVEQRNRSFGVAELSVMAGEQVTFVNNDVYGHNVYSDTKGAVFDIGLQEPGETRAITFAETAVVMVHCRIHPRMRLVIIVTE